MALAIVIGIIGCALTVWHIYKEACWMEEVDDRFNKVMYELAMKKKYGEHL